MIPERRLNQTWLALGGVVAWVTAASVMGITYGRGSFFLTMAAGVLLLVIWFLWQSTQNLTGEAPLTLEEALGLGAPSAEEERKESVLRMLKDLEYERAVGKIADDDFKELSRKYRAEAKALLLNLDESLAPARKRAEAKLKERLARDPASEADPANKAPANGLDNSTSGSDTEADPANEPNSSRTGSDADPDATTSSSEEDATASPHQSAAQAGATDGSPAISERPPSVSAAEAKEIANPEGQEGKA